MAIIKTQIQQIISQNNLNSVANVHFLLKVNLKDILQELMKAELEASLRYEKSKGRPFHGQQMQGTLLKTSKSQYGEFQVDDVPRDGEISSSQNSFPNI